MAALQLPQRPPQSFDLMLISVLLPLSYFQRLQYLLHIFKGFLEALDDAVNFFDRLLHRDR